MEAAILFWMAATGVFLVLEFLSAAMTSIWFAVGSLAALVAASLRAPLWLQISLFCVVSAVCFALLYPRLKHLLLRKRHATNADMTIGQTCLVTQVIDNVAASGTVSVGGKTWTARSVTGEVIEEGRLVEAVRIEGVKLMVTPLPEPAKTAETL